MPTTKIELRIDVSGKTELEGRLETAVTVALPERISDRQPVLFLWPGGGYGKGYFDIQVPGFEGYSQLEHHAERGFVVVACDHLGVGESSEPDRSALTPQIVAEVNRATVDEVLRLLRAGELTPDASPVPAPIVIGGAHSLGAMLLIVQQARQRTFDAVALLGYSAIRVEPPGLPPGRRTSSGADEAGNEQTALQAQARFYCHWEDVPAEIVDADMRGEFPFREPPLPMWGTDRQPGAYHWPIFSPGVAAHWAATIECPIFLGIGERSTVRDPWAEPAAYRRSRSITLFVCPRMAHAQNFASTRHLLWDTLVHWMQGAAA